MVDPAGQTLFERYAFRQRHPAQFRVRVARRDPCACFGATSTRPALADAFFCGGRELKHAAERQRGRKPHYVLVLLICRRNIVSGTTTIHRGDGVEVGRFTLTEALDAALLEDRRVFHGVTPVSAQDAGRAAYRDVLVVTFRGREGVGA